MAMSYAIPANVPQPRAGKDGVISAASVNAAAVLRNYHLNPRLDYGASQPSRPVGGRSGRRARSQAARAHRRGDRQRSRRAWRAHARTRESASSLSETRA